MPLMQIVRSLKKSLFLTPSILLLLFFIGGCARSAELKPVAADEVILAFGDSITFGTGASAGESYPSVLENLIGRRLVNAGVPGEISAEGLARLPEVLDREKPVLMILCHGGNDLLRHLDPVATADNLRGMITIAREKGVAVVLVGVPAPDLSFSPPAFYRKVAEEMQVPYEGKALPKILGKRSLKSDYIHPNAAGYRLLAERLADLLKKQGAI